MLNKWDFFLCIVSFSTLFMLCITKWKINKIIYAYFVSRLQYVFEHDNMYDWNMIFMDLICNFVVCAVPRCWMENRGIILKGTDHQFRLSISFYKTFKERIRNLPSWNTQSTLYNTFQSQQITHTQNFSIPRHKRRW